MPVTYESSRIRVHRAVCGPYANNAYLVADPRTGEAVVFDAPAEPDGLLREVGDARVQALIITHTHPDHVLGFDRMAEALRAPVACHPRDAAGLPRRADLELHDGATMRVGELDLLFLHTPGHTPGGICALVEGHLFDGDTLFPGGPGKTRTPEDFRQLLQSITGKLLPLPGDVRVHPGHGESTTIRQANEEYRSFASQPHPDDLCGDVLWLRARPGTG